MRTVYCYFDLEATGTDPYRDRIVEVSMRRVDMDSPRAPLQELHRVVDPGVPIPEKSTTVHGIDEARLLVEEAEPLEAHVEAIQDLVAGAVLVGYNSRSYDVPLLHTELRRHGGEGLEVDGDGTIVQPEVDLYRVWQQLEPRTLVGACRRWLGLDLEDAHSAEADAAVLPDLMRALYGELEQQVEEDPGGWEVLEDLSVPADQVDRAGRFARELDPEVGERIIFTFGKHQGRPAAEHPDYLNWMLGKGFPPDTQAVARRLLRGELE